MTGKHKSDSSLIKKGIKKGKKKVQNAKYFSHFFKNDFIINGMGVRAGLAKI